MIKRRVLLDEDWVSCKKKYEKTEYELEELLNKIHKVQNGDKKYRCKCTFAINGEIQINRNSIWYGDVYDENTVLLFSEFKVANIYISNKDLKFLFELVE